VAHQRLPAVRLGGDATDQVAQLVAIEIAVPADVDPLLVKRFT
jgi:hypothetical protein